MSAATAKKTAKKAPAKKAAKKVAKKVAKKAPAKAKKSAPKSDDFAVIETGGKQYIVCVGDVVEIELIGTHKEGDKIVFDKVLLSDNGKDTTIGDPYITGAKVSATYLGEKKGKKLSIIRFKAKSNRSRKIGHRQHYAEVEIVSL